MPSYRLCGRRKDIPDLISATNSVKVAFICSADRPPDALGSRFKIAFSSSECSRNFTKAEYGRIKQVDATDNCEVLITAPNANDTVSLYIREIHFLMGDCTSKVAVYDGTNKDAKLLSTSCGSPESRVISSTGSALYLHITMPENKVVPPSIDLSFTTTNKGRGCGGRIVDYSGAFASPFQGSNFRNNSECLWDITIPVPHQKIKLTFWEFNIGNKALCSTDYLEIFDVNENGDLNSRVKYCGGDNPSILICDTDHVIVKYVSSVNNAGTGWFIIFSVYHRLE